MKTLALLLCTAALAQAGLPPGYRLMEDSTSPDGKLAIAEPHELSEVDFDKATNPIVALPSQTVIGSIQGSAGLKEMNHGGASATWSDDSRLLLWQVEGKWGPRAVAFVSLDQDKIVKQADLIALGHAELLKRTKAAHPKAYAAAVKQNQGNGSAYPEGFTTSLTLQDPIAKLPATFVVTLTANPKGIEGYPAAAELQAFLFGTVNEKLEVNWGEFGAYDAQASERLLNEREGVEEALAHQFDAVLQSRSAKGKKKLQAEQDEWESTLDEIQDSWFMAGGLCSLLADQQHYVRVSDRVKQLAAMMPKK